MKKTYSREEKISYYKSQIEKANKRLAYLTSEHYQDWNGALQQDIDEKRLKAAAAVLKQFGLEIKKAGD